MWSWIVNQDKNNRQNNDFHNQLLYQKLPFDSKMISMSLSITQFVVTLPRNTAQVQFRASRKLVWVFLKLIYWKPPRLVKSVSHWRGSPNALLMVAGRQQPAAYEWGLHCCPKPIRSSRLWVKTTMQDCRRWDPRYHLSITQQNAAHKKDPITWNWFELVLYQVHWTQITSTLSRCTSVCSYEGLCLTNPQQKPQLLSIACGKALWAK